MNFKTPSVLLLAVFLAWGCAANEAQEGQEAAESAPVEQAAAAADDNADELICRRIKRTGSMRKTKVCATREEWEAAQNDMTDWRDGLDSF